MAYPSPKTRKYPSTFEKEPILFRGCGFSALRNVSWAVARLWWASAHHTPTLTLTYHTYTLDAHYAWARVFRRVHGRE